MLDIQDDISSYLAFSHYIDWNEPTQTANQPIGHTAVSSPPNSTTNSATPSISQGPHRRIGKKGTGGGGMMFLGNPKPKSSAKDPASEHP